MSLSKAELEIESGSALGESHTWTENEIPDHLRVYRVLEINGEAKNHWEVFSLWLATNEDILSDEAEEEGELLNLSSIKINFCPFCGEALNTN